MVRELYVSSHTSGKRLQYFLFVCSINSDKFAKNEAFAYFRWFYKLTTAMFLRLENFECRPFKIECVDTSCKEPITTRSVKLFIEYVYARL